jgi:mRNA-degrading endonuclease RelE of RelBE toxin-antitoxin system
MVVLHFHLDRVGAGCATFTTPLSFSFVPDTLMFYPQIFLKNQKYLELSPLPIGKTRIKKLTGFAPPLYRLRSGDFRAYYRIISKPIVILAITHKKDSEKLLKKLR